MAIAGHVSRKMLEHSAHIRMEAKRSAVAALSAANSSSEPDVTGVYVTTHVTNAAKRGSADLQLIEKNGGPGLT
jgi:hypothetical protein